MNKDHVKSRVDQAKGAIKEVTGHILGNDDMELDGNVQAEFGDLKKDIKKSC